MPILVNAERNLFTLHTKHSTYQMKVDALGTLLHTYYGSRIDETDMSCQIGFMNRGLSRLVSTALPRGTPAVITSLPV